MSDLGGSLRYFAGGDEVDYREYRRWKQWTINKMNVMDKLPTKARGSFVWTLLQGRALEIVEHLSEEDYQCEGGDGVIFKLLDQRWPQKERSDEIGEHVTEIFSLKAKDGETVRQWCGRARECFDRCKRKTAVDFPDEARGWILLQCSGMNEEQRAVVLARTQGDLKFDAMALSMRSCFPDFVVSRKRASGAHVVETKSVLENQMPADEPEPVADEISFNDVELFLAEHASGTGEEQVEAFDEGEVADILAVSWKEKRQELARLKQSRQFHKEGDAKRSFRIEIEELKKRTRCRKCNRIGHWARECRAKTSSTGPPSSAASSTTHGVSCVQNMVEEHFICTAGWCNQLTLVDKVRLRYGGEDKMTINPVHLVSSPGFAVLDSGCGKTIVGAKTLQSFRDIWESAGVPQPVAKPEENFFRYGNGACERSTEIVEMPICLAERRGVVQAAIVQGEAPLLLSRPALKRLGAEMNFQKDELKLFEGRQTVPMELNTAGQYMIPVSNFEPKPIEVCAADVTAPTADSAAPDDPVSCPDVPSPSTEVSVIGRKGKSKDYWVINHDKGLVIRKHIRPRSEKFTPCHAQCPVATADLSSNRITRWQTDGDQPMSEVHDEWTNPSDAHANVEVPVGKYWTGETVFALNPSVPRAPGTTGTDEVLMTQWTNKQSRQLDQHVSRLDRIATPSKPYHVIEVFSPPRFAQQTAVRGQTCLSADLLTGWDFRRCDHRKAMRQTVQNTPPELLVCCPPCTWAGGWFHLNKCLMDAKDLEEKRILTTLFVNFCCELIELQLDAGGYAVLEHPKPSMIWEFPKVQKLLKRMHLVECDMCRFGLRIPKGMLIKKATRLMVSHKSMKSLGVKCPGIQHPQHACHQPVAGSHPAVGSVSRYAGQYPQRFVRAVMDCVPSLRSQAVLSVTCHRPEECLVAARIRELDEDDESKVRNSLHKLHVNLGHPGNQHLVRILKHGGASQKALELAKELKCDHCLARAKPSPALPAQPERITVFNQRIGIDLKYLTGWTVNQKVAAVNIVDYASSFQVMVPLFGRPNAENIRQVVQERWISWAGQPTEIVCDPHRVNLSDVLTTPQELSGSTIHVTAADAHYQLGKVEVHGGWFNQVLEKVLSEFTPSSKETWLECVFAAHCKNELIQVYGMTPAQFIFGRNPKIPEHLLDEPVEVVPATAPLYEEEVARRVAVRHAARRAVLELQDNKALRLALAARPRHQKEPEPGHLVAYWRTQKWEQGQLNQHGRWHGLAVVLGKVGRNFVVVHKRQVIRCAPEQIRAATSEEREIVRAPHAELLGLKHAFEAGQIASRQYVDLIAQGYPTEQQVVDQPQIDQEQSQNRPVENVGHAQSLSERLQSTSAETASAGDAGNSSLVRTGEVEQQGSAGPADASLPDVAAGDDSAEYGPIRRRLRGKNGATALYRPAPMQSENFAEMMQEIVPDLVQRVLEPSPDAPDASMPSPRQAGTKRSASPSPVEGESSSQAPRLESSGSDGSVERPHGISAVMCYSDKNGELSASDRAELRRMFDAGVCTDVLLATYHQKRGSKEIAHVNQEPEHQKKIDEAKLAEWHVIEGKSGGRLVHGVEADHVRKKYPHRIMDSRYVVTLKQEEDSPVKIKARWCLLGHRDPDLSKKAVEGALQSPTLSQVSRSVLFQTIASKKWALALGDIKGAFLSAGPLPQRYRPLYSRLPPGGIPGVPSDALIEVTGHVYGLNDSPSAWQQKLHQVLTSVGFRACRFDPCLYTLRSPSGELVGICGVHVDDCATGGSGHVYDQAMTQLKQQFEFRKWRVHDGDFCGARYTQDPKTGEITMSQSKFASGIKPLHLSRSRCHDKTSLLTDQEVSCLRAINGSLNWLSTQSRPDLSAQVSFSQQSFPHPTVSDALAANNAIRRARQHADLCIVYRSIPLCDLAVICHSDAAYANAKGGATQGGYVIGFSHKELAGGNTCSWTAAFWKSHRLPRVVNSTLSAEAQSMSTAASMCEWISLVLADVQFGPCCAQSLWEAPRRPPCMLVTDCKSLFDHLKSPSAPSLDDRRTSIDIIIIREGVKRMSASVRWLPTDRMLADSMTKESADALDLLRACIKAGKYQISPEEDVLEWRANERQRRKQISENRAKFCAYLVSLGSNP